MESYLADLEIAKYLAEGGKVEEAQRLINYAKKHNPEPSNISQKMAATLEQRIMDEAYKNGLPKRLELAKESAEQGNVERAQQHINCAKEYEAKLNPIAYLTQILNVGLVIAFEQEIMDEAYKNGIPKRLELAKFAFEVGDLESAEISRNYAKEYAEKLTSVSG